MKTNSMNEHQTELYRIMNKLTSEYIGGYENTMLDYEEDSEEYKYAEEFLNQSHEDLVEFFYYEIMSECKTGSYRSHARFAGKEFLMSIIDKRLTKWGY